jgi:hypothetical protein
VRYEEIRFAEVEFPQPVKPRLVGGWLGVGLVSIRRNFACSCRESFGSRSARKKS